MYDDIPSEHVVKVNGEQFLTGYYEQWLEQIKPKPSATQYYSVDEFWFDLALNVMGDPQSCTCALQQDRVGVVLTEWLSADAVDAVRKIIRIDTNTILSRGRGSSLILLHDPSADSKRFVLFMQSSKSPEFMVPFVQVPTSAGVAAYSPDITFRCPMATDWVLHYKQTELKQPKSPATSFILQDFWKAWNESDAADDWSDYGYISASRGSNKI